MSNEIPAAMESAGAMGQPTENLSTHVAPSASPPGWGQSKPWWEDTEPDVKTLAKRICQSGGQDPEHCVALSPVPEVCTPIGGAYFVGHAELMPLWCCYIDVARHALALVRSKPAAAETVAEPQAADIEALLPKDERPADPETKWRQETGLDGSRFSD